MIGSKPSDQGSETEHHVPLKFEPDLYQWVSMLAGNEVCSQPIDAARMCHKHMLTMWEHLGRNVRVLRALCDHPHFRFSEDGIDDSMIRDQARAVAKAMEFMSQDLERLLDTPEAEDTIILQPRPVRNNDAQSDTN